MDGDCIPNKEETHQIMLRGSAELLELCTGPVVPFATWGSEFIHCKIEKVAEASFGEVYEYSHLEAPRPGGEIDRSVLKIIPLRTLPRVIETNVHGRRAEIWSQLSTSEAHSVAKEIRIMQAMSSIGGFAQLKGVRVVQGRPPTALCAAYRAWNVEQEECFKPGSLFPDPASPESYPDDQLWAVIEMAHAGDNLENMINDGRCDTIWSTWDVFWQICTAVAKAERLYEFEHRDLHPGNICVQPRIPVTDPRRKLGFSSLKTTIIDYGLSRCSLPGGEVVAHDLSKITGLFDGDGARAYQYDIYRFMRDSIMDEDGPVSAQVDARPTVWYQYQPRTNLIWLHLNLEELMQHPLSDSPPPGAPDSPIWGKKAEHIRQVLGVISDWLCPNTARDIQSASDLVERAVQEGWLDSSDVLGERQSE